MPVFDEWGCEQVFRAIERRVEVFADKSEGLTETEQYVVPAVGLAVSAVLALAQERFTSVEAVLDELIERP